MNAYTFSDVLIIPKYSEISTRKDVDTSSNFGTFKLNIPIFSANMRTITGPEMAKTLITEGAIGVMHRFDTSDNILNMFLSLQKDTIPCIMSIGVNSNTDKYLFNNLYQNGCRLFCIDIAHGHCLAMKDMIKWIKSNFIGVTLIAGNVATGEAIYDLADWGVDIGKVGIGGGSACQTRKNTGIGVPQLFALQQVREEITKQHLNIKIIADGGLTNVGDIAKALKFADGCMLGKMLAGTTETPGSVFKNKDGQYYKVYMGSASGENKISNNQNPDYIEGIATEVPFRGHVKYILKEIKEGLQSAFSYVGAKNLKEFQEKAEFIHISEGSRVESKI
jgi:IMP dehydrogenase